MFVFNYEAGATALTGWGMWLLIFCALFALNEVSRRYKWCGLFCFLILPIILSIMWFTVLKDSTYTDWFHLAKVYSATAGCLGFWFIRHHKWTDKISGEQKRLVDKKWALCFPPLILAINIIEAVIRDIEVGLSYSGGTGFDVGADILFGGPWNYMNAAAGILNIITITGWFGICLRKKTKKDGGMDMLWPDMLWFWIIPYDLWNFAYTYNCLPGHAWYCGFALLLAATLCAFTTGKGAWLQHRAHTLALWCMFAQTFPLFQDEGMFKVVSTNNPTIMFVVSFIALLSNIGIFVFMIYRIKVSKNNPYKGELFSDLNVYKKIKALAE